MWGMGGVVGVFIYPGRLVLCGLGSFGGGLWWFDDGLGCFCGGLGWFGGGLGGFGVSMDRLMCDKRGLRQACAHENILYPHTLNRYFCKKG